MGKKKLSILGLSYSQTQSGAYALVLAEENGQRRIPIIIGGAEAQAIAIELEGLNPLRPLTHDLFIGVAKAFNIEMLEVNIFKLEEGIFYSELVCTNGGENVKIDARTSDAIALALRFKCPIYTNEDVLVKAGIYIDFEEKAKEAGTPPKPDANSLRDRTIDELQELLEKAIAEEEYEFASELRDEIKRRKE